MLSRHAGGGQRGAWHMVLAACGADRKTAADGMRAIFDESGGEIGWRTTVQGPTYPKFSATTHAWHQPRPRPLYPPGAMHAAQWPRSTASSSRILEDAQAQAASTNTPKHADRAYSLPASVTLKRDQQQCRAISRSCPLDVGDNRSRALLLRVLRLKRNRHVDLAYSMST
jgi:hypothetical protein